MHIGKESFWVIFGQLLAVIASLVGVRFLTTLLAPAEYGKLAVILSFAAIIQYLPGMAVSDTAMRYFSIATATNQCRLFFVSLVRIFVYLTVLIAFLYIPMTVLGAQYFGEYEDIILPACVFAVSSVGYMILVGVFNGSRKRRSVAGIQSLFQIARFAMASLLVWYFAPTKYWATWGFAWGALFTLFIGALILVKDMKYSVNNTHHAHQDMLREMLNYGWPILVTGFLAWISYNVDRWSLALNTSNDDVGKYFALYQVSYLPALMGAQTLRQIVSPFVYQNLSLAEGLVEKKQTHKTNYIIAWYLLLLFTVIFLLSLLCHESVFRLVVGEEYREISYLWPFMLLAGGISISSAGLLISMFAENKTKAMISLKLVTTLVLVMCVIVGSFYFGVDGVVYALLISSIIEYMLSYILVSKNLRLLYS